MCNQIPQKEICHYVSDLLSEQQRWNFQLALSAHLEPGIWQGKMECAWPLVLLCDL